MDENAEIEITPAMIEAGEDAVSDLNLEWATREEIAVAVFRAMTLAQRHGYKSRDRNVPEGGYGEVAGFGLRPVPLGPVIL
jgi:hypothetical protein